MAEQFWYTSCRVGMEGTTGIQVRAASPGLARNLKEFRIRLGGVLNYSLPEGGTSFNTSAEQAPIALSWIAVAQERILLHKSFAGFDSDRRPGNFFTHLISNLPQGFNAHQAIATWGADFWRSSDQSLAPNSFSLDSIHDLTLHPTSPFQPSELNIELRAKLEILVKAFLSRDAKRRIYIAAEPDTVALLIWGLTQCLPSQLCEDITFSTYESNVTGANTLITATCRLEHLAQSGTFNLPQECYAGFNVAINLYPGARPDTSVTAPPAIATFAAFAVNSLWYQDGELQAILNAAAAELHVTVDSLIETFNRERTSVEAWDSTTVLGVLKNPTRARKYLGMVAFQNKLVDTATSKPIWWSSDAKPALEYLRRPGITNQSINEGLIALADVALRRAASEISIGVETNLAILVDGIAATCRPDQLLGNSTARLQLLDILSQEYRNIPDTNTPINLRVSLVEQWGQLSPLPPQYKVEPCLRVSWEQADALLSRNLPQDWKEYIADELVKLSPPPQWNSIEQTFSKYSDLFQSALVRQITSPSYSSSTLALFKLAWENNYSKRADLLLALLSQDNAPFDQILAIAKLDESTFEQMLGSRQQRETFKSIYTRSQETQRLVQNYISNLTISKCKNSQTFDALNALDPYLNQATSSRGRAWLTISKFIHTAQFSGETLNPVAKEIKFLFPDQGGQRQAVKELVSTLARRLDGQNGTEALRSILICLGEPFDDSPVPLYVDLLRQAEHNYFSDQDKSITRFVPFFQLYLRHYNREFFDVRQREQLKPSIKRVLETIQSSGRKGIEKLGNEVIYGRNNQVDADYQGAWNNLLMEFGLGGAAPTQGPSLIAGWTSKIPFLQGLEKRHYALVGTMLLALCLLGCVIISVAKPGAVTQFAVALGQLFGSSVNKSPKEDSTPRVTAVANISPTARPSQTPPPPSPTLANPESTAILEPTPTPKSLEPTQSPPTQETSTPQQPVQVTPVILSPTVTLIPSTPCPSPIRIVFVRETFLDGSIFKPGEKFTKTWTLRNISPCKIDSPVLIFNPEVQITNDAGVVIQTIKNGILMQAPERIPQQPVEARAVFTVAVELTAPNNAGRYWSTWELRTQNNELLRAIYAEIIVQ